MIEIQHKQTLSQLEILDYMYSKHLVSPSNTIKALEHAGVHLSHSLTIEDLVPYDQDHFGGVKETENCVALLSIERRSNILDIGSGLGGPARYIAYKTGARVTGIEIQPNRFEFAQRFTALVNLEHLVTFLRADFTLVSLRRSLYTHIIACLSILHMPNKKKAITKIGGALLEGGVVFIEDYYLKHKLSSTDKLELLETISCPGLVTIDGYIKTLEECGIRIREVTDTTNRWKRIVEERREAYNHDLDNLGKQFGLDVALNAMSFAEGVMRIFDKGLIGGVRLVGEKR